jgi:hypothetical protein
MRISTSKSIKPNKRLLNSSKPSTPKVFMKKDYMMPLTT